jgi:hypothetical protein
VDNLDVISGEPATASERRSPLAWVRGEHVAAVAFALPMLVIFTAFSWYPIIRLVVLVSADEPHRSADVGGSAELPGRSATHFSPRPSEF